MRGRGARSQYVKRPFSLGHAAHRHGFFKPDLVPIVMQPFEETKTVVVLGTTRIERPAGQHAGERRHIGLDIAAVHAERVKLHQFSRVILVEPRNGFPGSWHSSRGRWRS